jgi:hypothetical protein
MRLFARLNRPGLPTVLIVATILSLILAACNNGSQPAY